MIDWLRRSRRDERGTITPLIIAFGTSIILLLVVVVDAAQLWVYQRGLHSIADGASLDAANALDPAAIYSGGVDETIELNRELAQTAVNEYVQRAVSDQAASTSGIDCNVPPLADPTEVTVVCTGSAKLPIVGYVTNGRSEVEISSEATARTYATGG